MDTEDHDLLKHIGEQCAEEAKKFRAEFDQFRTVLQTQPALVPNGEILDWIRKLPEQRDWRESDDSDFDLLMDSLSFTNTSISMEGIRLAWATFQDSHDDIKTFSYEEYPILEGMAQWYFEHREDNGRVEMEMVARSLAIYEYLIQELLEEAAASYENVLADIGVTVVAQYCGIRQFERAKFFVQLLEQEYFAGRMKDEEYADLMWLYEQILVQQKGESLSTVERELYRINRLCWDTISDRDRQIEALSDEGVQLREEIAQAKTNPDLKSARQRLLQKFGDIWNKLHADTRTHLELGEAFSHPPHSQQMPGIVPSAFSLAVKAELLARLFKPHGKLDVDFLKLAKTGNPLGLLSKAGKNKLPPEEHKLFRSALTEVVGDAPFLKPYTICKLDRLINDRNQAQHPEGNPLNTHENLKIFLKDVWDSGWLIAFLKRLHTPRVRET